MYSQAVQSRLGDHWEPRAPFLVEGFERPVGGVGVDGRIDRFEVAGDLLALAPRDVLETVPDEVNDARLNDRLGEGRLDRLREALEAVDAADQTVLDAALA